MTDDEVLFKAIQFCLKYGNNCAKCLLNGHLCISQNGNLILGEEVKDDKINFVKFTKEFREMIKVISED